MLVTKSDYKNYSGIDLEIEFKGFSDNVSGYVTSWLEDVENFVRDFIKMHFFGDVDNDEVLKKAILYQAEYILENGKNNRLAPRAYQVLRVNGMANMSQGRMKRYG